MKLHISGDRRARHRGRLALVAVLPVLAVFFVTFAVSASGTTASCSNPATLGSGASGSSFEIDTNANLVVNTPGCIDWLNTPNTGVYRTGVLPKNDKASGGTDDAFGQGTSEDDANPTIVAGSIPPNKSDLKAFGVYTEAVPGAKYLELFWSRVQNPSGTTNMDFELNQKFCNPAANPTNCANNGSGVTPETPLRTVGDKLITYDLANGGTVPTISIRTWGGSAWGAATVISGGANPGALGSVNTSQINPPDGGPLGTLTAFTFGEAAINFNQLFPVGSSCTALGGAYLKSRSSTSFNSEVKDFVAPEQISVTNCPAITTSATASVTIGTAISDTATLTGATTNATGSFSFALYGPFSGSGPDSCDQAHLVTTGLASVPIGSPDAQGNFTKTSGSFTPTAVGRYEWIASYTSGDANNQNATGKCNDSGEQSVVNAGNPGITTTPNPSSGTLGTSTLTLNDSASLTGGSNPQGTITFSLFAPSDATCSGTPAYTKAVSVSGNGSYATTDSGTITGSNVANAAGTWRWTAGYVSSNGNNNNASSGCQAEQVTVSPASPGITTTPSAGGIVGTTLNDSASLTGGFNPAGTILFRLYAPSDASCSGTPAYTKTVTVNGNGTYQTTDSGPSTGSNVSNANGTWRWTATYTSGNGNNNNTASGCQDEQVTINPASPAVNTTPSPASGTLGTSALTLSDTASLTGGVNPVGTITFRLYAPSDSSCSGTPAYSKAISVNGNGSYATTDSGTATGSNVANAAGTWRWTASYVSSNGNNNNAASGCQDEQVTVNPASPGIATTPSAGGVVGTTLNDSASLTLGFNPQGTITFRLYGPGDASCSGSPAYTSAVTVNGNGPYSSSGGTGTGSNVANAAGTWRWTASYVSSNGNNNNTASGCQDEQVTIGPANPGISTTPNPSSATVDAGLSLNDSASLTGGFNPSGTITFSLYTPSDATCAGTPAYTKTVSVSGNGSYATTGAGSSTGSNIGNVAGTWRWTASYTGDVNNNPAASGCTQEPVTVNKADTSQATAQTLLPNDMTTISSTFGGIGGTADFFLYGPNNPTCDPAGAAAVYTQSGVPVAFDMLLGVYDAGTSNSSTFVSAPGTYRWLVVYSGDSNHNGSTSPCGVEQFSFTNNSPGP